MHIHLTYPKSKTHKETIKFRNNLRRSKKLREDYSKLKKEAVRIADNKGSVYRKLKESFMIKNSI